VVLRTALKCDSKKILAAAAYSTVTMEGFACRGTSCRRAPCRGNMSQGAMYCSAIDSDIGSGTGTAPFDTRRDPFPPLCVVSADRGAFEDMREVGAVD
jgi:hypothetical protein